MNYKQEMDKITAIASDTFFQLHGDDGDCCIKILVDVGLYDSFVIQWLEEDGSPAVYDTVIEFNKAFFENLGRSLSCTNNSPTDGSVGYWIEPSMDEPYDPDSHKTSFFERYDYWLNNGMSKEQGHAMHETFRLLHKALTDKGDSIEHVKQLFNAKEEFHNQVMRYYSEY